ncbi:MAG: sulfatase-like hydrolase/transferase, partial [Acidobacteria bacterium]|nr:sulfatase-like hydrolase/transferase [Acidobacteriota bacterium]
YAYLYGQGRPLGQDIEFTMEVSRQGKSRELRRIKAPQISLPLFQDLDLRRGDRIVMRFTGSGIVYYSRPILYERYSASRATERTNVTGLTPNLDRFARDAVCLENAYAQTSWTLPSFMSMFTALNEYNHGVGVKTPLRPDQLSLVENLSGSFVTFGYHGGMKTINGFARGFDSYQELLQTTPPFPQGGKALFDKALETLREGSFPRPLQPARGVPAAAEPQSALNRPAGGQCGPAGENLSPGRRRAQEIAQGAVPGGGPGLRLLFRGFHRPPAADEAL